jgi:DNA-binding MarR family transcriptional regulator
MFDHKLFLIESPPRTTPVPDPAIAAPIAQAGAAGPSSPAPGDSLTPVEFHILQALRRIIRAVDLYSRKLYVKFRVTGPQLLCLDVLRAAGPLAAAELARRMHVSPCTVTGIVDRLEAKSLVERRRDDPDRRVVRLDLTGRGRELLASAPSPLQDRLLHELSRLPDLERAAIAMALQRIVHLMEADELDAAPILVDGPLTAEPSGGEVPAP